MLDAGDTAGNKTEVIPAFGLYSYGVGQTVPKQGTHSEEDVGRIAMGLLLWLGCVEGRPSEEVAAKVVGAMMEHCMRTIGTLRGSESEGSLTAPLYWGPARWWLPC